MSASSAANLQSTNNQLIKCIEDLRMRRATISQEIQKEEEEKAKIQHNLQILHEKLNRVNDQLKRKQEASQEYGKTLKETEGAYNKIIESSQTLLHVLKRESSTLDEKYKGLSV